jgi:hypothetical protein
MNKKKCSKESISVMSDDACHQVVDAAVELPPRRAHSGRPLGGTNGVRNVACRFCVMFDAMLAHANG